MPYHIFLVEDHPVMQRAYAQLLAREPDLELCGTAASAEDAPFDFFLKMEEEKPLAAFAALLGDEGLAIMRAARASIKDYQKFIEAWNEAVGLGND